MHAYLPCDAVGIYFYIYCANYCSVFVPGFLVQKLNNNSHNKCPVLVQKLNNNSVQKLVLVQKLNNNSDRKCKSKSPKTTRLQKSAV